MSELEELPSWAGRSTDGEQPSQSGPLQEQAVAQAPIQPIEPRRRKPWKIAMLALFGVAALLGMGVLGYVLADQNNNSTETATDSSDTEAGQLGSEELTDNADVAEAEAADAEAEGATETEAGDGDEAITVDVEESDDAAESTDEAMDETIDGEATDEAATDETTDETEATDTAGADSGRMAVFRGGKVYLSGAVPSEEVGQFIQEKAAAVLGPDNVVNEYTIDPETVIDPGESTPLIVEDVVLFEFNSVEVAEPFFPILDLGTLLLRQNPQASVTVVTRADAVGSEEVNLEVARRRAQAVINYWLGQGVNADQILADPRGEEGASEDDDAETAARQRRAEFIITGLLD